MNSADQPAGRAAISELNFDNILDEACGRLLNKKAELSLKRIGELEKLLADFAEELDEALAAENCHE